MTLIRCVCGQGLAKVDGKYEIICPKCKRKISGNTVSGK